MPCMGASNKTLRRLGIAAVVLGTVLGTAATAAAQAPETWRRRDGVRLRGGFSLNGGLSAAVTFGDDRRYVGGAVGLAGRLGVQFNHVVALYYQNSPTVFVLPVVDPSSRNYNLYVGAVDYNSLLLNLTFVDMIELGLGPSVDAWAVLGCGTNVDGICRTATTWGLGGHARFAINIGGLAGRGPRRSGFSMGVDFHPVYLGSNTFFMTLTAGIGAEWY
jgi:hypothetical protein